MKNSIPTILVTGANGQLGKELQVLARYYQRYNFLFTTKEELSVSDEHVVTTFFNNNIIDFCINCAAYTAVDKAESEKELAFLINATGVSNIAKACARQDTTLIHISTDYVFDGTAVDPYRETYLTNPINVYGASKLLGEELALQYNPNTIIIRTSWLFSSFGSNFVKTMMRLMKEKESINVVNDQFGCPTYAADLAQAILKIISQSSLKKNNIYHYCNEGFTTWYNFALAIKEIIKNTCTIQPINTDQYPIAAQRPRYSVMDATAIKKDFQLTIPRWKESLIKCITMLSFD